MCFALVLYRRLLLVGYDEGNDCYKKTDTARRLPAVAFSQDAKRPDCRRLRRCDRKFRALLFACVKAAESQSELTHRLFWRCSVAVRRIFVHRSTTRVAVEGSAVALLGRGRFLYKNCGSGCYPGDSPVSSRVIPKHSEYACPFCCWVG